MDTALRATSGRGGVPARGRDYYLEVGREWIRTYGAEDLVAAAFSPGAAKRGARPDLVEAYYTPRADGTAWPSLNSIKQAFDGSFTKFRMALGLPPNVTGTHRRRPPGEAEPIFHVRERRVVEAGESTVWLRKQLSAAERRALRAEERLEAAKRDLEAVKRSPDDGDRVRELRERLADEKARRKVVQRELFNAERREERARARAAAAVVRDDPRALREVDRLTDRLAAAEARVRELESVPGEVRVVEKTTVRERRVKDGRAEKRADAAESRATALRRELNESERARRELQERLSGLRSAAIESAAVSDLVRAAESRRIAAESRAMELARLVVGERRQLSSAEVAALRSDGPAGEPLVAIALRRVAEAKGEGKEPLRAALRRLAGAALDWGDRL